MDYNKKIGMFDEDTAKKQMAEAFSKTPNTNEPEVKLSDHFELPTTNQYQKKIPVSYTLRPDIKEGIEALAITQGFRSSSAFVEQILVQVLQHK